MENVPFFLLWVHFDSKGNAWNCIQAKSSSEAEQNRSKKTVNQKAEPAAENCIYLTDGLLSLAGGYWSVGFVSSWVFPARVGQSPSRFIEAQRFDEWLTSFGRYPTRFGMCSTRPGLANLCWGMEGIQLNFGAQLSFSTTRWWRGMCSWPHLLMSTSVSFLRCALRLSTSALAQLFTSGTICYTTDHTVDSKWGLQLVPREQHPTFSIFTSSGKVETKERNRQTHTHTPHTKVHTDTHHWERERERERDTHTHTNHIHNFD